MCIRDSRNSSRNRFNDDYDQFEDSDRPSRRFKPKDDDLEDDYMEGRSRRRSISRAIPESAVSRRRPSLRESNQFENEVPKRRRNRSEDNRMSNEDRRGSFGERRSSRSEIKRGSRPLSNQEVSRKSNNSSLKDASTSSNNPKRSSIRSQTSTEKVEDASFSTNINEVKKPRQARSSAASARSTSKNKTGRYTVGTKKNINRDNSSRFDD